ncbi:MAG: ABC transporter permease [Anaerolineae bacterium]|nr:ABC transporter permease [Anaerolineae bacterium]
MSLRRTIAIAHKELRHIYRDRQILFITLLAPVFVLFLLANTFSLDTETMRIGVMDRDHSPASRRYIEALTAEGTVRVVCMCADYEEIDHLLVRGEAAAVIVIPPNFGASLAAQQPEILLAVIDSSDYFQGRGTYVDLAARTMAFAESQARMGTSPPIPPLQFSSRSLYNPTLKWLHSMVPGLMAAAFCFPAIAVALACTREIEQGSYESLLSTPMRMPEYILGKLLPYLGVGSLGAFFSWMLALLWFRVPFRGTLGSFIVLALAFLLSLMSLSILIGTASGNQRHAVIIIVLTFFIPTFFMSGLLRPLEADSPFAQVLKLILPAANYVTINRGVFLKGLGLDQLGREVTSLLRISGMALLASYLVARRKVA